jgi:hypothetical protein
VPNLSCSCNIDTYSPINFFLQIAIKALLHLPLVLQIKNIKRNTGLRWSYDAFPFIITEDLDNLSTDYLKNTPSLQGGSVRDTLNCAWGGTLNLHCNPHPKVDRSQFVAYDLNQLGLFNDSWFS